ncbi:hypothetical protein AVEN_225821-1 [Araneus ventricosus]|uniref:Uncharacterized protein n=1 Tax=Araneus ventricosus TaxID=182803 RepID=A0A4Y2BAP2_ARAVE|nr:hypothetical protein AVEN_225821-1 [Araneus ventricosus]
MENDVLENRLTEIPFGNSAEGCSNPRNLRKSTFSNCQLSGILPKRFIFSCIGFLASTLAISLNTNLSIVIVSMVDRSNESLVHVKSSNECLLVDVPREVEAEQKVWRLSFQIVLSVSSIRLQTINY